MVRTKQSTHIQTVKKKIMKIARILTNYMFNVEPIFLKKF